MNYAPPLPIRPNPAALDVRAMNAVSNTFLALSAFAALLLVVQWAANQGAFTISRLRISGDLDHANPISMRAHAVGRFKGTFFTLDLAHAKDVLEDVPWVRSATVRRIWPNGLHAEITEHKAVALWAADGQEKLLNSFGEVFTANPGEAQDDLPLLTGPVGSSNSVWRFYQLLSQRLGLRDTSVVSLTLNAQQEWSAELDDGLRLMLGRDGGELWARLDRYLRSREQARARLGQVSNALGRDWVRVDLRHNLGYAVAIGRPDSDSPAGSGDTAGDAEVAPGKSKTQASVTKTTAINNSVKNELSRS